MKKLRSLRTFLANSVQELTDNPEKLHVFVEKGEGHSVPRMLTLSYTERYTAVLVIEGFTSDTSILFVPLLAWLKLNQPDRNEDKAFGYEAEILNDTTVDIEIKIELTEDIIVTKNPDETLSVSTAPEPLPALDFGGQEADPTNPMADWLLHNA